MVILLKRLAENETGQDLAEYGIALAIIATGVGLIALAIGSDVSTLWVTAQTQIAAVL